jgi:hypothetical protein
MYLGRSGCAGSPPTVTVDQYYIAPTSEPHWAVDRVHGSYTAVLTLVALFVREAMKWTSSSEGWSALPGHVLAVHPQG